VSDISETVIHSLTDITDSLPWKPVTVPGLPIPWLGVHVPAIDTHGRPWVWEIVTPTQYNESEHLQDDPMILAVAQDTVVVTLRNQEKPHSSVRMQVPVTHAPDEIEMHCPLDLDSKWVVTMETGWSANAVGRAAQNWIEGNTVSKATIDISEPILRPDIRYQLSPDIDVESAAFDSLLTLSLHDAGFVSSTLSSIHGALAAYR
jgi:hypothetical protein